MNKPADSQYRFRLFYKPLQRRREREEERARQEKDRLEAEERERRDSKVQTVRYTEG